MAYVTRKRGELLRYTLHIETPEERQAMDSLFWSGTMLEKDLHVSYIKVVLLELAAEVKRLQSKKENNL